MQYVIIGNGVAGINAANVIRNRDSDSDITIVSYETDHFFSRTALMYVFSGQLSERCVEPFERDHYQRMNFNRVRDRVITLDPERKILKMENGNDLAYDRLLIASGSVPVSGPWPGSELENVGHFVTWQDLEWLRQKAPHAKKVAIIGGGLIGIEAAEILLTAGLEVTFIIREDHYWPIALSKEESDIVVDHMRHHGCDVRLSTLIKNIEGNNGMAAAIKTENGETIPCDLAVITIGVRPQTDFLKESGLSFGERGGILVDDYLHTGLPDIWAAGDCTSVKWFNGMERPEQLWYTSRDQGLVAGHNIVGDRKVYKRGTFYNSAKFFDIEYTTVGLVNFGIEGEQNWFQHEPGTCFTERVVYGKDGEVIGFNFLGRRWDHTILAQWIEERRKIEWVLDHLDRARFDEEFMPKFSVRSKP
jgi:NADPH-dependent 2,4-dienoyl-CoA reductase/sulfur reductase-like enzyme